MKAFVRIIDEVESMKQMVRGSAILLVLVASVLSLSAQNDKAAIQQLKGELEQKNIVYFATAVPGAAGTYVGVQHIKGMALIVIHCRAAADNMSFLDEEIAKKDYRKVYKDLSMMRGNDYSLVFDFGLDSLEIESGSGDFIQENDKVRYLNKSFTENNFTTQEEYAAFVDKYRESYVRWLQVISKQLR
ncbi:MAG TPA: hypothetical protein PLY66_11615 [Acidobacteriota bacterium]|nr:hypothetical protein [Acidobacteriota bacterium]HOT01644.1 hypothetical protein [Acidobacteriota bacterium]HQF88804.1 hypothetical protein [Acidobacteriota bacterium]HQG92297.1 hypothetical protein [Acidobacteriota bacterium]